MEQPTGPLGNMTLGERIAADLDGDSFPPDVSVLLPVLEAIRDRIREDADFTLVQKQAVLEALALAGFDDHQRIHFRS